MYLLYSLLLTFGFIILLPRFAIDAVRSRKYTTGLGQRLGNLPKLPASDRPVIWLHCVSVGETEAARPLVRALRDRFPSFRLVVSTTTVTGQQVALRAFAGEAAVVFYFPIDWAWVIRRVLRELQPAAVLIMETELWPNLLRQCHKQSVPVALVNGRISQKSFGRYQKIRAFMKRVLDDLQIALMQSEEDANRIRKLGMAPERLLVSGNLKFDSSTTAETDAALTSSIRGRFSFGNTRLIVAASTHAPEENILIEAFKRVRESDLGIGVRLLIAPRHPERFDEVTRLIQASGLSYARRSFAPSDADVACDIVLLDSIGELRAVLPLADIAFVGGSIAPHGGHNMLEPAAYGVCVVTGPHTHNFAAVAQALLAEDALVQLPEVELADAPAELASTLDKLLRDDSQREQIGRRALAVCERNRGATEYTIRVVADLLKSSEALNESIPFPAVQATAAK